MKISDNSLVEYSYTITDQNNHIVEQVDQPVIHVFGHDQGMHKKIVSAMRGCRSGDLVKVILEPHEGYGDIDPNLVIVEKIKDVPESVRKIGAETQFQNSQGEAKTFYVTDISDDKITLDGNHPLAGQAINFTFKILNVRLATPTDIAQTTPTRSPSDSPDTPPPTLQ